MSEEEDDATIQMDVSAIQAMYGAKASSAEEGDDDGTTQIDRSEIDRLIASERVDRSTMMGYAVGPLVPPGSEDDGTTQIDRSEIDAMIRADQEPPRPAAAPPTERRKPDPTQMVDKRAIEMLQSRDEEHALAYQFERGEFSEVSETDDEPERVVPTLENPPVPSSIRAYGDTAPVGFDSPFAGLEPGRAPAPSRSHEAPGLVPTLGAGPSQVSPVRQAPSSPMTMPSSISADLAPLLEPAPEVASGLNADDLFGDIGPMTPMAPFDAPVMREPTEDLQTSGLSLEAPKKKSSVLPYFVGALLVFAVAAVGAAGYIITMGG